MKIDPKEACTGCGLPIRDAHKTIEQHIACEAAEQARVRVELDAQDAVAPKRDRRFLARNAPLRVQPVTVQYETTTARRGQMTTTVKERTFPSEAALQRWAEKNAGNVTILRYLSEAK